MVETSPSLRLLVAAGGTGGHIFPAVAVIEALQTHLQNAVDVQWLGSATRMEATLVPELGFPFTPMPITGFRKLLSLDTLLLPIRVLSSIARARVLIRRFRPHVALVTGAYISYPAGVAAAQMGVPLVVMESNVNLGKTNSQLVGKASAIVLTYHETLDRLPAAVRSRAAVLGNPVRTVFANPSSAEQARMAFGLDAHRPTVLVVGGSLGACSINHTVQAMVNRWAQTQAPCQLIWQTGRHFSAQIPDALKGAVVSQEFIADVQLAYAAASIVVCRSGATTVSELGVIGKPAILIPLPSASTDEQRRNAQAISSRGGAVVIDDGVIDTRLETELMSLLNDGERLERMAQAMRATGKPDAAIRVAELVVSLWRQSA